MDNYLLEIFGSPLNVLSTIVKMIRDEHVKIRRIYSLLDSYDNKDVV